MEKYYKKFYEVGNNAYYSIKFNDDEYLAIESFLLGKTPILKRKKRIQQGLKLLELTPCIRILLQCIYTSKSKSVDKEFPDMNTFEIPSENGVIDKIKEFYDSAKDNELSNLDNWYNDQLALCETDEDKKELDKQFKDIKKSIEKLDMFKGMSIKLNDMEKRCPVLTSLRVNGLRFLYMQNYTSLYDIVYMYDLDDFGTCTIYKFDMIKGKIKGVEHFIIGKDLLNAYYEYIFKKES